jgi:rRNA maturation RNase YbeY
MVLYCASSLLCYSSFVTPNPPPPLYPSLAFGFVILYTDTMIEIIRIAHSIPSHPYEKMADAILGKKYTLTVAFIGEKRAHALNAQHRGASYVPNVLSFPLDTTTGEIYICPLVAKREAKKFSMTVNGYIGYLFIHGCLHLKGHDHGATMERAEQKYVRQFALA